MEQESLIISPSKVLFHRIVFLQCSQCEVVVRPTVLLTISEVQTLRIILLAFSRYLVQSRHIRRSPKPRSFFLRRGLATEDVKPLPESNIVRTTEFPAHIQ